MIVGGALKVLTPVGLVGLSFMIYTHIQKYTCIYIYTFNFYLTSV